MGCGVSTENIGWSMCFIVEYLRINPMTIHVILQFASLPFRPSSYIGLANYRTRYHIYSSKRHIRPLRTILFGGLGLGLGLRVGVLGVVRVWVRVRVSIRVRVGVALVRG